MFYPYLHVHFVRSSQVQESLLKEVKAVFQGMPAYIRIEIHSEPLFATDTSWPAIFEAVRGVRQAREIPRNQAICFFTDEQNDCNWFSATDVQPIFETQGLDGQASGDPNIFVQTNDWEIFTPGDLPKILALEVVQNILLFYVAQFRDDLDYAHERPRGCLNDFCEFKEEFKEKVRQADICEECLPLYENVPTNLMTTFCEVLELARRSALNIAPLLRDDGTQAWPYPVALTKKRSTQRRTSSAERFRTLIDYYDALVRYSCIVDVAISGTHLDLGPRPALGSWVAEQHRRRGRIIPDGLTNIAENNQIVAKRNEFAHSYSLVNGSYEAVAEKIERALLEMEKLLTDLLALELVHVKEITLTGGRYVVIGNFLRGTDSNFEHFERIVDNPHEAGLTDVGHIYICDDNHFYSTFPYLRHDTCNSCQMPQYLLFDGTDGHESTYIDLAVGHRTHKH